MEKINMPHHLPAAVKPNTVPKMESPMAVEPYVAMPNKAHFVPKAEVLAYHPYPAANPAASPAVSGYATSTSVILVLFILLLIISRAGLPGVK